MFTRTQKLNNKLTAEYIELELTAITEAVPYTKAYIDLAYKVLFAITWMAERHELTEDEMEVLLSKNSTLTSVTELVAKTNQTADAITTIVHRVARITSSEKIRTTHQLVIIR